ncbi:FAD-dependent thymidylate synthase [Cytobacillus purgationiresistens]|uniref:Flavin-dependent thymidylate synthase n=1 Tax=Cytobacillus purgationiresistens TaxID=863449 RepID=A0ABU0AJ13_9BACI|nr:FAD-dependent thymidylate synthase [Cytobacillus purgationiresistens]MDQ0270757.1 thymidylate synthase (FAD) [Cytobacillus purgationiresistens]
MNVKLIAHTQLSEDFCDHIYRLTPDMDEYVTEKVSDGQAVALTAIRTCYSPGKPSEIVAKEGAKYFGNKATDGEGGSEADRLFRHIVRSRHTSTLEHLSFTFAIEGVSRALLAQLTRHRVGFSFSVQSQRYVRFGSGDKSGGFDYVVPESVEGKRCKMSDSDGEYSAETLFNQAMAISQQVYDDLRKAGVPSEDARAVLPNAAATNLVMTANLRALLEFYAKRKAGNGAQVEIAKLAEELKEAVINAEPWTRQFFEG